MRSTDKCADAATVAAWLDRSLTPEESVAWEAHFAVCLRCQAILATAGRDLEPAGVPVKLQPSLAPTTVTPVLRFPRWRLAWAAPVALAATVLLAVWVARDLPREPVSQVSVTDSERPAKADVLIAQPSSPSIEAPTATPEAGSRPDATAAGGTDAGAPPTAMAPVPATPRPPEAPPAARPERARPAESEERLLEAREPKLAKREQANAPAPASAEAARTTRPAAGVAPAPTQDARPTDTRDEAAPILSAAPEGRADESASNLRRASPSVRFSSPSRAVSWLLQPDGSILAIRAGRPPELLAATGDDLRAGGAASDTVAWAVGARGAAWRTTDGRHWARVSPPADVLLTAVRVDDAERATVTTADGRRFETTNGGNTWEPR